MVMTTDDRSNDGVVVWEHGGEESPGNNPELMLVGRLWSPRNTHTKSAIDTMIKVWDSKGKVVGNVIDPVLKIFVFRFDDGRDKAKVLEDQPWHFNGHIWCFNDPNPTGKITDVPLFHVPVWVRMYNPPVVGRSSIENAKRIGNMLGGFVKLDGLSCSGVENSLRIRVMHDIRVPMKAHMPILTRDGVLSNYDIKYERIPLFCYGCGILGHGERDCEAGPYEEETLPFGPWLKASPWKPVKPENSRDRNCARELKVLFDEEASRKEQADVMRLVEKLQSIAVSLKAKKSNGVGCGGERSDESIGVNGSLLFRSKIGKETEVVSDHAIEERNKGGEKVFGNAGSCVQGEGRLGHSVRKIIKINKKEMYDKGRRQSVELYESGGGGSKRKVKYVENEGGEVEGVSYKRGRVDSTEVDNSMQVAEADIDQPREQQ